MSRILEAIDALVELLDAFPTDAEAWCELADVYQSQAMYSQACFCLEEALLVSPNAWNVSVLHHIVQIAFVLTICSLVCSYMPN